MMKTILLVACAALAAYLLFSRAPSNLATIEAPATTSTSLANITPIAAAPTTNHQTPFSMEHQIATFSQTATNLPDAQLRQTAESLINELKTSVANGVDLESAYAQAQQLTPNIESDPKQLEALNYKVWMDMKSNYTPPAPLTAAQHLQLETYKNASDKAINEVLRTMEGDEAKRTTIREKLSALRLEIFGSNTAQPLGF